MSWNYRIVKLSAGYELCEVYYSGDGEPTMFGTATAQGDTPEEVQEVLDRMAQGAMKPVITKWEKQYGGGDDS